MHVAAVDQLKAHAARTGIAVSEIIRRAFDLYLFLDDLYNEEIPEEYLTPATQADGTPYPEATKRMVFHLDPYLAVRIQAWQGSEAELLGYATLVYLSQFRKLNPDAPDVYEAPAFEPPEGEEGQTTQDPTNPSDELEPTDGGTPELPLDEGGGLNATEELDESGNPVGTIYDENGNPSDPYGNPVGTLYDDEGNPVNLTEDGELDPEYQDSSSVAVDQDPEATDPTQEGEVNPEADDASPYFEAGPGELDDEGNPMQDEHGNPVGTLYETQEDGTICSVNLDEEGNLVDIDQQPA
jgi:hypothetical protein